MNYESFLARKLTRELPTGIDGAQVGADYLFPFQRDLVGWALRRGRAAVFAQTGLGKTRMELEWARRVQEHTGRDVLILAPLAVGAQTAREAERIGVRVKPCRDGSEVEAGITITNYERLHRFDPSRFGGVVLDESSIIKHSDAKTFGILCEAFGQTAFRLAATATPSPNDFTELGTHAQFLGICSKVEMLSEYFVHDGGATQDWRLKGHARGAFWRWVAGWAALVRHPADLGYADARYDLPPLLVEAHTVASSMAEARAAGLLFPVEAQSLVERRAARKSSVDKRVAECAAIVNASRETWVVWTDLNAESKALAATISGAVEVTGSDDIDVKEERLAAFCRGEYRVLVSKASIAGFGLNLQFCSHMAFVGVTDSFEAYFQAIRRCWRFGQERPVEVHIFASEAEGSVVANLRRKEEQAGVMAEELSRETRDAVRAEVRGSRRETTEYTPAIRMRIPLWMESA